MLCIQTVATAPVTQLKVNKFSKKLDRKPAMTQTRRWKILSPTPKVQGNPKSTTCKPEHFLGLKFLPWNCIWPLVSAPETRYFLMYYFKYFKLKDSSWWKSTKILSTWNLQRSAGRCQMAPQRRLQPDILWSPHRWTCDRHTDRILCEREVPSHQRWCCDCYPAYWRRGRWC